MALMSQHMWTPQELQQSMLDAYGDGSHANNPAGTSPDAAAAGQVNFWNRFSAISPYLQQAQAWQTGLGQENQSGDWMNWQNRMQDIAGNNASSFTNGTNFVPTTQTATPGGFNYALMSDSQRANLFGAPQPTSGSFAPSPSFDPNAGYGFNSLNPQQSALGSGSSGFSTGLMGYQPVSGFGMGGFGMGGGQPQPQPQQVSQQVSQQTSPSAFSLPAAPLAQPALPQVQDAGTNWGFSPPSNVYSPGWQTPPLSAPKSPWAN